MSVDYRSEEERLVAEQAIGLYRAVLQAMHTAPHGRGLDTMETVLLNQGREHLRSILEQVMSTHPEVQKGGVCTRPCTCGKSVSFRYYSPKTVITVMGEVAVSRRYYAGRSCGHTDIPWDQWAGVKSGHLTPQAYRLAVLAGSHWSFDVVSRRLKEFCGIWISDQTIRQVTNQAGAEAGQWLANAPEPLNTLQSSHGNGEFYTDGTCINTRAGWREMRINIFAVRPDGPSVGPEQWADRYLPPTEARLAWGGIQECHELGPQWRARADALGWKEGCGLSVLADGAKWIWNQVAQHLPASECVVDVYHVSEHLYTCGRALFGEKSPQAPTWAEQQVNSLISHGPMCLLRNLENQPAPADPNAKHPAVQALIDYLKPNIDGLWYADRLRRGLPIGSGMVEGACKNVIGRRMKCNSARWLAKRADHMASLCCLHYSDHWEQFWGRPAA